jgi:hypothetical protein
MAKITLSEIEVKNLLFDRDCISTEIEGKKKLPLEDIAEVLAGRVKSEEGTDLFSPIKRETKT